MLKHFLLTYYRNVTSHKLHALINYVGLSIAITVLVLLFLFVNNEFTFDKYHKHADRIFRLTTTITTPAGDNNLAMANTAFAFMLKKELPEIEEFACIDIGGSYHVQYKDRIFPDELIRISTPGIFDVFSYTLVKGDPNTLLTEPNTVVLTETLAKKLFDNENPIGKSVTFDDENYTVKGIIKDLPENTDLTFDALLSSEVDGTGDLLDWEEYYVYMLVDKDAIPALQNKINMLSERAYRPLLTEDYEGISIRYILQPLTEIHFDTSYLGDTPKGNKTSVYAFSCLGILILIIACINYINLTVTQTFYRNKEIMIRRVTGSGKAVIFTQLLGESVLTTLLSLLVALFLVVQLIPVLNNLTDKSFNAYSLTNVSVIATIGLVVFFVGFISGIYPVVFQFNLIRNKEYPFISKKGGFVKVSRLLVIVQFTLSIFMICSILVVMKQISFMKNVDLGFNKDRILAIQINQESNKHIDILKKELHDALTTDMIATGGSGTQLGSAGEWMKAINSMKNANNDDIQFIANIPEIDDNYLEVFGIKLLEGRNFSKDFATDYEESVIVNQTYVRTMGWTNPLGQFIYEDAKLKVIGVVSDFHFASLHNKIEPLMFRFQDIHPSYLFIKAFPDKINQIKSIWNNVFRDIPFEYQYVDKNFEKQYRQDEKQKALFKYLSVLAILISCLGLYGLSSFTIARRTKEIGIRKVNGARITEVVNMLNRDFIKWILIAFVVACPIAWSAMHKWLQNFAYKTTLSWWVFAAAGAVAVTVALLTVSWQSWRAATRNPVEALRYE